MDVRVRFFIYMIIVVQNIEAKTRFEIKKGTRGAC